MSPATLQPPARPTPFAPAVRRCGECWAPLVKLDEHKAECAAGHQYRRFGDTLIPRDDRMATG